MHEWFQGVKTFLFIFTSHFLLGFGSLVNLKVLTLNFEWFSSEVHGELETKTISNFPHFVCLSTVMSLVLISDNFPDRSMIIKVKKQRF